MTITFHRQVPNWSSIIPGIETCTFGHCGYGFPQFNLIHEKDFRISLQEIINEEENATTPSYFKQDYKNYDKLLNLYKKWLNMDYNKALEELHLLMQNEVSYFRYDALFVDLQGNIVTYHQCCR